MTFETLSKFSPQHEDLVHDLAFDFYGSRLATCSSDQRIKVFDLIENEKGQVEWSLNDSWKVRFLLDSIYSNLGPRCCCFKSVLEPSGVRTNYCFMFV